MSEADRQPAQAARPKQKKSGFYRAARVLAGVLFHTLAPVRYHHPERVAGQPPFIVIANHDSFMDPIIMGYLIKGQDVTFLGKKELVNNKVAGKVLRNMHIIPVERHSTDMAAMRACIQALRDGCILGVFPEGTRHHAGLMEEIEAGVAMIALRSGAPLIPMYITPKFRLFRRTDCYVGQPIPTADLKARGIDRETCQALLERITATYADMAADAARQ